MTEFIAGVRKLGKTAKGVTIPEKHFRSGEIKVGEEYLFVATPIKRGELNDEPNEPSTDGELRTERNQQTVT